MHPPAIVTSPPSSCPVCTVPAARPGLGERLRSAYGLLDSDASLLRDCCLNSTLVSVFWAQYLISLGIVISKGILVAASPDCLLCPRFSSTSV